MTRLLVLLCLSLVSSVVLAGTNKKGLAFLEENKKKPGVVALPSGLQYKVLEKGEGKYNPAKETPCTCQIRGRTIDGKEITKSVNSFAPGDVVPGWEEALLLMVEGDKWELYIPSELAYGDKGNPPNIPGREVLIFELELLKIVGDGIPVATCVVKSHLNCNVREVQYIAKVRGWDSAKVTSELDRIQAMLRKSMSLENREWANRRANILEQLEPTGGGEQEQEL